MDQLEISGIIGERDESLDSVLTENGIGENFTADMMRDYLAQNTEGDISILVDTIGGDVRHGFEIYDLLQAEKNKGRVVKTYGKQFDSIGSIIFLAGSDGHRYAYKDAKPLIHNSWRNPEDLSGLMLNSQTLRAIAEDHDAADFEMMHVYLNYAGRDKKAQLQELMMNETELSDQQLLELNFATEIIAQPANARAASIRAMAFKSGLVAEAAKHYADSILIDGDKVLLIQRSLDDEFEPGAWAFPGGKIEDGELPESAAARELNEETSIKALEVKPIEKIEHENGATTHFYFVSDYDLGDMELEEDEVAGAEWFSIGNLPENIIKDQTDQYKSLISKSIKMSEKVTALEKGLTALKARLGLIEPKAMLVPLEGGETELFIYSEDGELEGKRAVIAEGGEPTDENAPAGTHKLRDGRSVTVGEGGIIESVQESESAMDKEKMAAMEEELQAAKEELQALKAQKAEAEKLANEAREALKGELKAMKDQIEELKSIVPGDDSAKPELEKMKAMKAAREEFEKMTPSQRRVAALKMNASKN